MVYRRCPLCALLFVALASGRSHAADNTWVGSGSATWDTTLSRWSSPSIWNNSNNDGAIFTTTGAGTITLGTGITVRSLDFHSGSYTINGGGNILTLTSSGTSSLGGAEIKVAPSLTATINAQIAGSAGLTKTGAGTLLLGGLNTYTGSTNVNAGILAFTAAQTSLTGQINVASGATLRFDVNDVFGGHATTSGPTVVVNGGTVSNNGDRFNTFQNLTLNGGTLGGTGGASSDYPTWSVRGTLTSTGTSFINPTGTNSGFSLGQDGDTTFNVTSGTLTVSTPIIDNQHTLGSAVQPGTLIKNGGGTMILTGTNTYTGGTTVNAGILQIGNSGTTGTLPGNATISGGTLRFARTDGGTLTQTFSGAGSLHLLGNSITTTFYTVSSTSNSHSGGTTVESATLQLGASGVIPDTGTLFLGSGANPGVLRLNGFNETIGSLSGSVTTSQVTNFGGVGTNTLTINQTANTTFAGRLGGGSVNDNNFAIVKDHPGSLDLTNSSNSYSGGTTLNLGMIGVNDLAHLGTGSLTINGGDIGGGESGARIVILSGSTSSAKNIILGNAGGAFTASATATSLTLSGTISGTGTLSLYSGGASTMSYTLSGSNSFNRPIIIGERAAVSVASIANSGTNSPLGAGNTIRLGSQILTGEGTLSYTGATASSNRAVILTTGRTGIIDVTTGTTTLTLSGVVSGAGALVKSGSGILELTNTSNSYSGGTAINGGTLSLGGSGVLATTGPIGFGGGTLKFTALNTTDYSSRFSTVASQQYRVDTNGQNVTLASALTSTGGSLTKSGAGTLILTANNTYSGGTTATAGTIQVGNGGATGSVGTGDVSINASGSLIFYRTGTVTVANVFSGSGQLAFDGVSVLDQSSYALTADNSSFTGTIRVGGVGGTLNSRLRFNNPNRLGGATSITVNSGSSLYFEGGTYSNTFHVAGIGWLEGAGNMGAMRFNNSTVGGAINLTDNTRFTLHSTDAASTISADITDGASSFAFERTGVSTLTLSGNNTYDGGTAINGGILALGSSGALGTTGTISFGGGTLQYSASNTTDYSARFSTAASQQYRIDTNGQNVTLATALTSSGGALTKSGAGILTLTANNTYSGGTTITAGALNLESADAIGTSGTITFNGGALQFSASNTTDYSSRFSTAAIQQYRIDTNGQDVTLASALTSSAGTMTKLGAGSLILTGNNTYSGGTTISGGTLQIGDGGTTGVLVGNIANNSILNFNRSNDVAYAGTISGTGLLTKSGAGILTLTGNNIYSGGTTISGGTLQIGDGGTTGVLVGNIANNSILNFNRSNDVAYAGTISGTGLLTKSGAGILTLTGNNIYSGGTAINGGVLSLGSSGALGATGTISFGGGALQFTASNTTDYSTRFSTAASQQYRIDTNSQNMTLASALTSTGGVLTKSGAGILTLTGNNTYDGGTTVNAGTLQVGSGGTSGDLSSGSVSIGSSGTVLFHRSTPLLTVSNSFSGTGLLAFDGTGVSSQSDYGLTGDNSAFSGTVRVGSGAGLTPSRVRVNNGNRLGTATVTVNSGSSLYFFGGTYNNTYNVAGNGWLEASGNLGALRFHNATVGGTINLTANTRFTVFTGDAASTVSATISDAASDFNIEKTGTGHLTLTGDNSYSGGTTLSAGTIALGSANAIGTSGTITFSGGTLQFSASNTTDYSSRFSTAASQQYRIDTNGQDVTLASGLTSSGGVLTKSGAGTLILTGNNTYDGGAAINGGVLSLGSSGALGTTGTISFGGGALQFTASNTADYSSRFSTAASQQYHINTNGQNVTLASALTSSGATLTKTGAGTLTLSGSNTYSGQTTIDAGTLAFTVAQTSLTGQINVASGATLRFGTGNVFGGHASTSAPTIVVNGGTVTNSVPVFNTLQNITLDGGTLSGIGGQNPTTYSSWSVRGTLTSNGTSVINPTGTNAGFNLGQDGDTSFDVQSGTLTISTRIIDNQNTPATAAQPGNLIKTGAGTLELSSGASTFSGSLDVNQGVVSIPVSGNGSSSAMGVLNGSRAINVNNGGTLSFTFNNVFGGIGMSAANLPILNIATGATVSATRYNAIGNVLLDGGTLTQASTDSGPFQGYQFLGTITATGTNGSTISETTGRGNHLLGSASGGTTFHVNTASTLLVSTALIDPSDDYASSGAGRLIKAGAGTLILSGSNTYSGETTISSGTLAFTTNQTSLTGQINVSSGATLQFEFGNIFGGHASTSAPTIVVTGGTFTNNGVWFNTLQNITLDGSTLTGIDGQNAVFPSWSVRGTLTSTGTSVINPTGTNAGFSLGQDGDTSFDVQSGTLTISTRIIDNQNTPATAAQPGKLIKTGAGTLILSGINTFTGGLTISRGAVNVASDSALGSASGVVSVNVLGSLNYTASTTTASGRTYDLTSSTLRTSVGATLTFNNATVGGGFLASTFATQTGSSNSLAGTTTAISSTVTLNGADSLLNFNHGGQLTVSSGATATLNLFYNMPAGRMTIGNGATVNAIDFQSSGVINITGTGQMINTGASQMVLGGGSVTNLGVYNPGNGQVTAGGTLNLGGQNLLVQGGQLRNNGAVGNGTIIVDFGGYVKGAGSFGSVLTQNGGIFSPGNSPGTATIGTTYINNGGILNIDIDAAGINSADGVGTAGGNPGWGRVLVTDELRITATPGSPYTITMTSLQIGGGSGPVYNFDNTKTHHWEVIQMQAGTQLFTTATGGTAIDPSTFVWDPNIVTINTNAFQNALAGGSFSTSFALNDAGAYSVYVNFTPTPEPGTVLGIAALGLGLVGFVRRRRLAARSDDPR